MSKVLDDDVMPANCDAIIIFPIYGQFRAIWKPDSGSIRKLTFSSTVTFYLAKTKNRPNIAFGKDTILAKKRILFAKKCWRQKN